MIQIKCYIFNNVQHPILLGLVGDEIRVGKAVLNYINNIIHAWCVVRKLWENYYISNRPFLPLQLL